MLSIRTVLHPTDFSEDSDYAFRVACSLARDHNARLILVHVAPNVVASGELAAVPSRPAEVWKALQEQLANLRPTDPGMSVEQHLRGGDPAEEILRLAQERKVDVIVLGTRGRTGLGRLLMGSVAEHIVRNAPCPVLAVRLPRRQASASEAPVPALAGGAEQTTR